VPADGASLGYSAVLLPHTDVGEVDWLGFESLLGRTIAAGLIPAVNMDTGYVQLLTEPDRARVLSTAASLAGAGGFAAGAFVPDTEGDAYDPAAYSRAAAQVAEAGGTPVVFPSWGLASLSEEGWVEAQASLGAELDRFIAFELGDMFVPYGRIYSLEAYRGLLGIPSCIGAKHSSLSRQAEWDRLALRNEVRADFSVFTGNDLAIDMVCYGSDYLLGLSAFAPDAFAERDRRWAAEEASFHELNDLLQYLGFFAFRPPVPGYRHDAAMFLTAAGLDRQRRHARRCADASRQRPCGARRHRRPPRTRWSDGDPVECGVTSASINGRSSSGARRHRRSACRDGRSSVSMLSVMVIDGRVVPCSIARPYPPP
jgi:dihydrodipicolinate synthase/N-acetylneuraminate lyase